MQNPKGVNVLASIFSRFTKSFYCYIWWILNTPIVWGNYNIICGAYGIKMSFWVNKRFYRLYCAVALVCKIARKFHVQFKRTVMYFLECAVKYIIKSLHFKNFHCAFSLPCLEYTLYGYDVFIHLWYTICVQGSNRPRFPDSDKFCDSRTKLHCRSITGDRCMQKLIQVWLFLLMKF